VKYIIYFLTFNCAVLTAQLNISFTIGANYSNANTILYGQDYYNEFQKYYKYKPAGNLGFEVSYIKNRCIFLTGLSFSIRAWESSLLKVPPFDFNKYLFNQYFEWPIQFGINFYNNKFNSSIGLVCTNRYQESDHEYYERNNFYGLDARVSSSWNITKKHAIVFSYTYCNLDDYLSNAESLYTFNSFALNYRYTFYHTKSKLKDNNLKQIKER